MGADLCRSGMLLSTAAKGAAPDVVPQLLNQLRVLLLDLLCKLLPTEREREKEITLSVPFERVNTTVQENIKF